MKESRNLMSTSSLLRSVLVSSLKQTQHGKQVDGVCAIIGLKRIAYLDQSFVGQTDNCSCMIFDRRQTIFRRRGSCDAPSDVLDLSAAEQQADAVPHLLQNA